MSKNTFKDSGTINSEGKEIDMDSKEQDQTLGLWSLKPFTRKAIYHWSIALESEEMENI